MPKDEVSMQRIRDWMEANPEQAKDVRRQNKSYVFFRITDLATEDEAVGGEGVPLVPGRSIAVDRSLHVYGTPFFIAADLPIANDKAATKFRRLMFAQDTGSAIVGPARADIYFGAGAEAARIAGRIRNPGQFVMLLPRELDPVEAAGDVPLPPERPGFFAQFSAGNMIDPTAEEVPLPEAKPAIEPEPKRKGGQNHEPPALSERRGTRVVDRLRAFDHAVAIPRASPTRYRQVTTPAPPLNQRPPRDRSNGVTRRPGKKRRRSRHSSGGSSNASRVAASRSKPASILHGFTQRRPMPRCCAFCAARRRMAPRSRSSLPAKERAGFRKRIGTMPRPGAACSDDRCRCGWRCRSSALSSSVLRMPMSGTAGRARFTSGCGA